MNLPSQKLKTNQGFTLIELLIALAVLSSIILLFLPILEINQKFQKQINQTYREDWYVFLIQSEKYLKTYRLEQAKETRLVFSTTNPEEVKQPVIEYYATKKLIRKTSTKGGYEPILMDVKRLKFQDEADYIRMEVEFLNGQIYQSFIAKNQTE